MENDEDQKDDTTNELKGSTGKSNTNAPKVAALWLWLRGHNKLVFTPPTTTTSASVDDDSSENKVLFTIVTCTSKAILTTDHFII